MVPSTASSSALPLEASQSISAFLAGAYDEDKSSLVEVDVPPTILAPFLAESPSSSLRLVDLIKHLGTSLTSEEEVIRSRAVVLLSRVAITLASSSSSSTRLFDKQATTTLATFFASKIEDGDTVANSIAQSLNAKTEAVPGSAPEYRRKKYPAGTEMLVASIQALTALAKLDSFASEAAKTTTDSLLRFSNPRLHPQAIRFLIYLLMDTLLSRHRPALKSIGDPFVKGYIDLVEGEKDPRNLIYIFAMDRVILIEWEMDAETVESFFDVTYCYFPITFRPPPDDPYGISTNTLRLALRRALTASPLLAPHALPLLIEKLQASGGNAKRDTLETLEEVLPVFGRSAAIAHLKELWEGFKIEILHASDEATSICSGKALQSLLNVLYRGEEEAQGVGTDMVADMLDELEEPAKQLAKPAATILAVMVRATPVTACLACHAALDQLLTMYKEPEEPSVRGPIISHVNTLVRALRETYDGSDENDSSVREEATAKEEGRFTFELPSSSTSIVKNGADADGWERRRSYEGDGRPLDRFRDLLLSTLAHGLRTSTTRVPAVELFVNMTHIQFLNVQEMRHLCDHVNELLVDPQADTVRVQTLEALRDLGNKKVMEESTLPLLFSHLPDRIAQGEMGDKSKGEIRRALGSLARLCDSAELFDMLIVKLSTKLDLVCVSTEEQEANEGYARGLINTMRVVLEEKMKRKDRDTARHGPTLIPRLIGNVVEATLQNAGTKTVAGGREVIRDIGVFITLLTRCLDESKQKQLGEGLYLTLMQGDLAYLSRHSALLQRRLSSSSSPQLSFLDGPTTTAQRNALYPLACAIIALKKNAATAPEDGIGFFGQLVRWTLDAQSQLQEDAGSDLLANYVNKHLDEPMSTGVSDLLDGMWKDELENRDRMQLDQKSSKAGLQRQKRVIRVWLVLARAFLVRSSQAGQQMVERILGLLRSSDVAIPATVIKEAARGLGRLTREDNVLCKDNGSVLRLLYKQRFITFLLPRLLEGYHHSRPSPAESATNNLSQAHKVASTLSIHLIAICSLLPTLPKATLLDKLTELFPLLIMALDLPNDDDDEGVKVSAANVITLAIAVGKREKEQNIVASVAGQDASSNGSAIPAKKNPLDLVIDHISSLLTRLLAILTAPTRPASFSSTGAAKVAALRCLAMMAKSVEYVILHPHKVNTLRILGHRGVGVDDPKRSVRIEAVEARDAWFALQGADEGGDEKK